MKPKLLTSGTATTSTVILGRSFATLRRNFFRMLKRRWWMALLTTIAGVGIMYAFNLVKPPPEYSSIARVMVTGKLAIGAGAFTEDAMSYYGTQAELMQSRKIMQLAQTRVLTQHPEIKPVETKITVQRSLAAGIFTIRATGADPTYPKLFLDAVVDEYLQFKRQLRGESSDTVLAAMTQQVYRTQEELKTTQIGLAEFQKTNNLVVLQDQAANAAFYLNKLNRQLSDNYMDVQLIQNMLKTDEMPDLKDIAINDVEASNRTTFSSRSADYISTLQKIRTLKIELDDQSRFLKPKHPRIVKLNDDIGRMQKMILVFKKESREALENRLAGMLLERSNLEKSVEDVKLKVYEVSRQVAEAERLKQDIDRNQRVYEQMLSTMKSVDVNTKIDQENISVLEPASPAFTPTDYSTLRLVGGGFLGMMIGLGIIGLLVFVDDKLGSMNELRSSTDVEIVGQIPEIKVTAGSTGMELLAPEDTRHEYAEAYRNLRSSLLFMDTDDVRPKTILVTSSVPNEGKSTVTSNLARAMAFAGSKVLLVEGDLRRGRLHSLFSVLNEPGLSDILEGRKKISEAIQILDAAETSNLHFIGRGKKVKNPGEQFLSAAMDRFLREVYNQYDYILIDSAPVMAADDTTSLAPKMDGVLFVVRSGFTSIRLLNQSLELLEKRQVKLLGIIYNRADTTGSEYGSYYKYSEYYMTDDDQDEKPKKEKSEAKKGKTEEKEIAAKS